ncbi:MAG: hypothetical protein IPO71_10920 [Nitrosomonas sp.]|nr:hypothetical protein [Nitrosomonas sp.]
MTTKTQRELNLEYWGRVHDMCDAYNKQHGTSISPQQCVKNDGYIWNSKVNPLFDGRKYDLAVAIIEDTPVFVGDKIYTKRTGQGITVTEGFLSAIDYTLTPPKKKRTFDLNGQQLPCPETAPCGFTISLFGHDFYYEEYEDVNKVERAIFDMLNNARDKE